ncbi:MAG: YbaB/EbfC family nucleoid-associated protein [Lachnospiraceae bacterium]|jgi:DNA-binding YbaB/EbfC family protein|nr:YbaB/EbfC family nucleoid-associated protein [Lachnospiraceae bacterium]
MAKHGGYMGGMPSNMGNLMKQAQRMQRQMEEKSQELEAKEYTVSTGGGAVELVMNGKLELSSLHIKPEVVDPDDVEMLEDLVLAAVNEAIRQVQSDKQSVMGGLTGGLGGFGL